MARRTIIGVMGGGTAAAKDTRAAYLLGSLIARHGWVLLNGGRNAGIMEASARGARENGGTTIGILPDGDAHRVSRFIDIPIITGMGAARNVINVLSSDIVVACPGGAGTLSEIALALKLGKAVILLDFDPGTVFDVYKKMNLLTFAATPEKAIEQIAARLCLSSDK